MKKLRRKGQQAENDKTERVTGLGRRTREEIAKWNQMKALRFQTGGRPMMRDVQPGESKRFSPPREGESAGTSNESNDSKNDTGALTCRR